METRGNLELCSIEWHVSDHEGLLFDFNKPSSKLKQMLGGMVIKCGEYKC